MTQIIIIDAKDLYSNVMNIILYENNKKFFLFKIENNI